MIRAHLATFPSRAGILMHAIDSILPQVDRLFVCLNDYSSIPVELSDSSKIEAMIPANDLKDAGKFAFVPKPDDFVFTIDDDIIFPPDYVQNTIATFDILNPVTNILGYLGHAWVLKGQTGKYGWRNFLFAKGSRHLTKVDIVGTGTACQIGRSFPTLDDIISAKGFVDMRYSRLHHSAGRRMWILPREDNYMINNMPTGLLGDSLFETVSKLRPPAMVRKQMLMMRELSPHSGLKYDKIQRLECKSP